MERIRDFFDDTIEYIKDHWVASLIICVAILAIIAVVLVICLTGGSRDEDSAQWGQGITEGIPAFGEEYHSFSSTEKSHTMYFENVTTEQVKNYEAILSENCGIKFSGEIYPRSASFNDKIIVIHYNVTEMKLSVTVTQKENN